MYNLEDLQLNCHNKIMNTTENLDRKTTEIDRLIKELKPYGVASIARTGPLIMSKGSEITQINKGKIL